jgi:cobalamin-dependent methionine synthase I
LLRHILKAALTDAREELEPAVRAHGCEVEASGPYPAILEDAIVGESARGVLAEGKAMLKKIIEGRWLTANAVFGLFPAARVNHEDIEI